MASSQITPLAWDSQTFGFPVARVTSADLSEHELWAAIQQAQRDAYELVYWTTAADRQVPARLLDHFGGRCVDRKVTFRRSLAPVDESVSTSKEVVTAVVAPGPATPELLELALTAGGYSRFRVDPQMPASCFRQLYETWMERSVRREIADDVLAAFLPERPEAPAGMVTLRCHQSVGQIGLIATAPWARRRGVGSALLEAAHEAFRSRGALTAEVVTQAPNLPACQLYIRAGYELTQCAAVYHFWPRRAALPRAA